MDRFDLVAESKTEILLSFMRINNNIITINLDETIIFTKESEFNCFNGNWNTR